MFDKIICVGKNYLKHALELGESVPTEPVFFIKPPSALFSVEGPTNTLKLPTRHEVHHELELVFRIQSNGEGGFELSHFTFGLDLTLRDLQTQLKKAGQPWEKAKVFAHSAVIGPWEQVTAMERVLKHKFTLSVNGKLRQQGLGEDMRWPPQELLTEIQNWFPIKSGDLLFTGTPEGVGPIHPGDVVNVNSDCDVNYELQCE
jgi:2-keto-4-pentenoate hydratase/2-oxohepta-3-ene-1,7-dioic acid hydratase in catechol pathway